jgi:Ni/Fe-hydrogenase 1 B-type cytochrome subunit
MTVQRSSDTSEQYRLYRVWDIPTRVFHWINAITVLCLIATGLALLNDDALGLSSSGKITLKGVHVSIGYIMSANLIWRFATGFLGNRYARWQAVLPIGKEYWKSLRDYLRSMVAGRPQQFLGHNPLGRIAVCILFALLTVQLITGLIIAGTDLYWPPFGSWFAHWVALPGVDANAIHAGTGDLINKDALKALRAFRGPIVEVHEYSFYGLAFFIFLHLFAVVITELREGGNIISAMFTGKKFLKRRPADLD